MQSLQGIRVLELGEMVAVPYAAKLLADLGADVIKIEPPTGDRARTYGPFPPGADQEPEKSGLFLGLNTNKRSVVLDVTTETGAQALADYVTEADIVLHDFGADRAAALGLDGSTVLAAHPSLVICAITPFGQTGPHASYEAEEINIVHGGGWGNLIPGDDPDPNAAPLTVYGHPAQCQSAMAAAFASLGAFFKAQLTGVGEVIDHSSMAHVAGMLEASFIAWSYLGKLSSRSEGRILNPWGIFRCTDGLIFLVTVEQDQWERLVDMMGRPEWALLDIFATAADRAKNRDVLQIYLQEWTSQHRVDDLFHRGQEHRICFAPVFSMADLEKQQHLIDRGFFASAAHPDAGELTYLGSPARVEPSSWKLTSAAPRLDEHAGAGFGQRPPEWTVPPPAVEAKRHARPLEGIRVIDFSWVWAGPFCTMHLAFLGADVVKVESSQRPGLGRRLPVHPPELEPTLNTCGYFNQWDQGKRSVEIDLGSPHALDTVLGLIAGADVVVDNYATGVMDRLGLSDSVLRQTNPDIIIASVTGFGHTGPLAHYMGYGPTTAPLSGLTSMTGHVGGRPEEAGISFGDPAAGLTAAYSIMAALVGRRRGGDPERIDVSLWEATAANAVDLWMGHAIGAPAPERMGNRNPSMAPHGVFRCAGDDKWVSIACVDDAAWQRLAALLGGEALDARFSSVSGRKANEDELESLLTAYTQAQDTWEVTTQLQTAGVAAYPSLDCAELEVNEQLVARDFWERFDHPEVGARTHSGVAWRTLNATNGVTRRAPLLGEHTAEILGS